MTKTPGQLVQHSPEDVTNQPPPLEDFLDDVQHKEVLARRIVEQLAVGMQASLLIQHGSPAVAEAFVRSRLGGEHGQVFGTLPQDVQFAKIIKRSLPETCAGIF